MDFSTQVLKQALKYIEIFAGSDILYKITMYKDEGLSIELGDFSIDALASPDLELGGWAVNSGEGDMVEIKDELGDALEYCLKAIAIAKKSEYESLIAQAFHARDLADKVRKIQEDKK